MLDPRVKELREAMARFSGGGGGGVAVRDPRARPAPVATAPSAVPRAAPTATVPSAAASAPSAAASRPDGPTLMDFLPFMKPKTFGDYSTGE